jgi:single-strand DNA-binding protein
MAYGLNKVMLIGHVGQDPELKYTPQGAAVVNFSLATNESYKDTNGQMVDRTEWHRIVAWRKLAEVLGQYLHKGSKVYIAGKLQTRSWDDKDGNKRYTTEIVAEDFVFLDAKGGGGAGAPEIGGGSYGDALPDAGGSAKDDDLPF